MSKFIVLLHDDDLSGSLDPEKSNASELDVYGPFESIREAAEWIEDVDEDARWLCHVHEIQPRTSHPKHKEQA